MNTLEQAVIEAAMKWAQASTDEEMDRTCRTLISATASLAHPSADTGREAGDPTDTGREAETDVLWEALRQVQADLAMALRSLEDAVRSLDRS